MSHDLSLIVAMTIAVGSSTSTALLSTIRTATIEQLLDYRSHRNDEEVLVAGSGSQGVPDVRVDGWLAVVPACFAVAFKQCVSGC